jgi:hypothetical protein
MTATSPRLCSSLDPSLEAYLRLKEALERQYSTERTILGSLDAFLTTVQADLTSDTFAASSATLERLMPGVRRNWLRVVRNLCLYRRRMMPDAFVPDPTGFPKPRVPFRRLAFLSGSGRKRQQIGDTAPQIGCQEPRGCSPRRF